MKESEEKVYFAFSATLRIHGGELPLALISQRLGLKPTHAHKKGERRGKLSPPFRDDAWHFQPALPEEAPLAEHIEALWRLIKPHTRYLKALKKKHKVDVFCGYRSNCDHAGFEVAHGALELFRALEIPFGVSVIIA